MLKARLQGNPTHVRITVFPHPSPESEGCRFSVTFATPRNAIRVSFNVGVLKYIADPPSDTWLKSLLAEDAVSLSDLREVWLVNVATTFHTHTHHCPPDSFSANTTATILCRMSLLDTLVLATVGHPNHRLGEHFSPVLSVLPDVAHAEASMVQLKTLRLVFFDAFPTPADPPGHNRIELRFQSMLGQLSHGMYRYLEHLVVEMSPRFEIGDAESVVPQLRESFRTVRINMISEVPAMPLPPCCVEPDSGPGGSCTWTNPLM